MVLERSAKANAMLGSPIEACEATRVSPYGQRLNSNKLTACRVIISVAKTRTDRLLPCMPCNGEFKPITVKKGWISRNLRLNN